MKYKIGDKVRVRKDLIVGNIYDNLEMFVPDMLKYKGKIITISESGTGYLNKCYTAKNIKKWYFTDSMLEKA